MIDQPGHWTHQELVTPLATSIREDLDRNGTHFTRGSHHFFTSALFAWRRHKLESLVTTTIGRKLARNLVAETRIHITTVVRTLVLVEVDGRKVLGLHFLKVLITNTNELVQKLVTDLTLNTLMHALAVNVTRGGTVIDVSEHVLTMTDHALQVAPVANDVAVLTLVVTTDHVLGDLAVRIRLTTVSLVGAVLLLLRKRNRTHRVEGDGREESKVLVEEVFKELDEVVLLLLRGIKHDLDGNVVDVSLDLLEDLVAGSVTGILIVSKDGTIVVKDIDGLGRGNSTELRCSWGREAAYVGLESGGVVFTDLVVEIGAAVVTDLSFNEDEGVVGDGVAVDLVGHDTKTDEGLGMKGGGRGIRDRGRRNTRGSPCR